MSPVRPAVLACVAAMLVAGCGGGEEAPSFDAPSLNAQSGLVRGYGATGKSAGRDESYEPTGAILADSEFRPWQDGFSFENYGNDVGPQNMTPEQVEEIFGEQVCLTGTGDDCELIPPAKQWMENQNAAMGGGHCMGFSVTALQMFVDSLDPGDYGAEQPVDLEIQGNLPLQEKIAQTWVYQDLPLVKEGIVQGTPTELMDRLEESLKSGDETYTIGIFNDTGGHAITPIAIEDRGDGLAAILVYDNNFPGIIRAVEVDLDADEYTYTGGPNPKDLNQVYSGTAEDQAMVLLPTSPGEKQQPCPFCDPASLGDAPRGYSFGKVLAKEERYDEITLLGNPENHAHLVLEDRKGNKTGFVGGEFINEIPGAEIDRSFTIQNWETAPEPSYRIPVGLQVQVTIDGEALTKPATHDLTLIGPGEYFEVNEIKLKPGQKDYVTFEAGGGGLNYETNAKIGSSPLIGGGLVRGEGDDLEAYYFIASPVGIEGGANMALVVDQEEGLVGIDTAGTTGDLAGTGLATYVFTITRATADGQIVNWAPPEEGLFLKGGDDGQVAVVKYDKPYRANQRIPVIVKSPGEKPTTQYLIPEKEE